MSSERLFAMVPDTVVTIDLPKHPQAITIRCHQVWGDRVTLTVRTWDGKPHLVRIRKGERAEISSGRTVILTLDPTQIEKGWSLFALDCPVSAGRFRGRMPRIRSAGVRVTAHDGLPVRR